MQSDAKNKKQLTELIRKKAEELGFALCGIAKAEALSIEKDHLKNWLAKSHHAEMHYMEKHFEKRTNPAKLVPDALSVISVLYNYFPARDVFRNRHYKISKYAFGTDYHFVMKKKLKTLLQFIRSLKEVKNARIFVDSAPVMDKVWAVKSGLGWIGKNTCLINRKEGSFFFIGEIILDVELDYNARIQKDLCGGCTRCIKACPTGALVAPYQIDARKCISYQTIEYKGAYPKTLDLDFKNRIFGCDICQDVCPWNKSSKAHQEEEFLPDDDLVKMTKEDWEQLSAEQFKGLFKKSAVKRTGYEGLMRNIAYVKKQEEEQENP